MYQEADNPFIQLFPTDADWSLLGYAPSNLIMAARANFMYSALDDGRRKLRAHPPRSLSAIIVLSIRVTGCMNNGITSCPATKSLRRQHSEFGTVQQLNIKHDVPRDQVRLDVAAILAEVLTTSQAVVYPCAGCNISCRVRVESMANIMEAPSSVSHAEISRAMHSHQALGYAKLQSLIGAARDQGWISRSEYAALSLITYHGETLSSMARDSLNKIRALIRKGETADPVFKVLFEATEEDRDVMRRRGIQQIQKGIRRAQAALEGTKDANDRTSLEKHIRGMRALIEQFERRPLEVD